MRTAMTVLILALSAGCAAGNGSEGDNIFTTEVKDKDVITPTTRTWHYDSMEYCVDVFLQACNQFLPPDQCPTAVDGEPCNHPTPLCGKRNAANSIFYLYECT